VTAWRCSWEARLMDVWILHRAGYSSGSARSGAFLASKQESPVFVYPDWVLVWAVKRIFAQMKLAEKPGGSKF